MKDMPAAADDDVPVDPSEQRRGRRKKRYVAPPEVVLGADRFVFGNCAYFVMVTLERLHVRKAQHPYVQVPST